jgi:TrbL/VirB6 plasmid conjugal transfer protein
MPSDGILNGVLADFQSACLAYQPLLVAWAIRILSATTFLGFGIVMVDTARRRDFWTMMDAFFMSLFRIGIVYVVLANAQEWGQGIIDLGKTVGVGVSGQSPDVMTPSGIYDLGSATFYTLANAGTYMMWLHPIDAITYHIITYVVWLTWLCAAVIYLFVLIHCAYVVAIGPIKISFATLEYTWPMLIVWFEALLSIAIKLMATLLTLAIGLTEANSWAANFASLGLKINLEPNYYAIQALGEAAIFALCLWSLPVMAHRLVRTHLGSGITYDDVGARTMVNAGKNAATAVARAATKAAKAGIKAGLKAAA